MKRILMAMAALAASVSLSAQDKLWYDTPADAWLQALPIGNSHMGAMVYGGPSHEELQLNDETFWSGGPHDNNSPRSLGRLQEVRDLIFAGQPFAGAGVLPAGHVDRADRHSFPDIHQPGVGKPDPFHLAPIRAGTFAQFPQDSADLVAAGGKRTAFQSRKFLRKPDLSG